jgi:hypothetical protein
MFARLMQALNTIESCNDRYASIGNRFTEIDHKLNKLQRTLDNLCLKTSEVRDNQTEQLTFDKLKYIINEVAQTVESIVEHDDGQLE